MQLLQPFASEPQLAKIVLTAEASRCNHCLQLRYRLKHPDQTVLMPSEPTKGIRANQLWEHTCFEAFFAIPGQQQYWEVNMSPACAWNVYRFSAYRHNLQEETAIASLDVKAARLANDLQLEATVELESLIPMQAHLELALTAVLKLPQGCSYWAARHPSTQPDFHWRGGFQLMS
jgi:hypothetical protein